MVCERAGRVYACVWKRHLSSVKTRTSQSDDIYSQDKWSINFSGPHTHTQLVNRNGALKKEKKKTGSASSTDLGPSRRPEGEWWLENTLSLRWPLLSVAWMMTEQGKGAPSLAERLPRCVCVPVQASERAHVNTSSPQLFSPPREPEQINVNSNSCIFGLFSRSRRVAWLASTLPHLATKEDLRGCWFRIFCVCEHRGVAAAWKINF